MLIPSLQPVLVPTQMQQDDDATTTPAPSR